MTDGIQFTDDSAQRIDRVVNHVEHFILQTQVEPRRVAFTQSPWMYAKVSSGSSITAASLSSPTNFLYDLWVPDPASGATPVPFIVSPNSSDLGLTGVNRSTGTASAGKMLKVEFGYGEWSPKWEDC